MVGTGIYPQAHAPISFGSRARDPPRRGVFTRPTTGEGPRRPWKYRAPRNVSGPWASRAEVSRKGRTSSSKGSRGGISGSAPPPMVSLTFFASFVGRRGTAAALPLSLSLWHGETVGELRDGHTHPFILVALYDGEGARIMHALHHEPV